MRKLKVLVSGNAVSSVHLVEVVIDVSVSDIIAALVNMFQLPLADFYGRKLLYELRDVNSGQVIPPQYMLAEIGILPAAHLALDVSTIEDVIPPLTYREQLSSHLDSTFSSSMTMESEEFSRFPVYAEKRKSRLSRRTFLVTFGAIAGMSGVGLSYAAFHTTIQMKLGSLITGGAVPPTPRVQKQTKPNPPTATVQRPVKPKPVPMARPLQTFTHHHGTVRSVAWSSTNNILASGGDDKHVFVWGMDGVVQQDITHQDSVHALAWSPDGQRLVTGSNTQVAFFNANTGMVLARSTHQHTQTVTSLAWSPHTLMSVVSGSADRKAIVWDSDTYHVVTTYRQHTAGIDAVAWSANGQVVASSSEGGYVRVWTAATAQNVHGYYQDANSPLRSLAFSPIGAQLAAGGNDGIVRLWNALTCGTTGVRCTDTPQRIHVSSMAVLALAWSPDGHLLAVGGLDGSFSIWDLAHPQQPLFSARQRDSVYSLAWSSDGKYLATASGTSVIVWEWM